MGDMYSRYNMPDATSRTQDLETYAKTLAFASNLDKDELNKLIKKVVADTPNYSAAGYAIGGLKQAQKQLYTELYSKIHNMV
jgi:hypothetical protein